MIHQVRFLNIAVTNRCNLRCSMCDIWKEKVHEDLPVRLVRKVLESGCLDKAPDITLTGGEPFMHDGLWQITEAILTKDPRWLKGLSTNGTRTQATLRFLRDFSKRLRADFTLHISLDGINCHDDQRGRSLARVLKTLHAVKRGYPSLPVKIKFTITERNYSDIIPTFKFCQANGLDFRVKLAEYEKNYTNKLGSDDFLLSVAARKAVVRDLLKVERAKRRSGDRNAAFIAALVRSLQGAARPAPCQTPLQRLFLMPNGDAFTCVHAPRIGNLHDQSLNKMWAASLKRNLPAAKRQACPGCVSYHGAAIKRHDVRRTLTRDTKERG